MNEKKKSNVVNLKKALHNRIERSRKKSLFDLIDKIIENTPYKQEYKNQTRRKKLEKILNYVIELKKYNDSLLFSNAESSQGIIEFCFILTNFF